MSDKILISTKFKRDSGFCQMTGKKLRCIVIRMQKTSDIIWQDAQHQVLFKLLDEIAEENSAALILDRLKFYAESHFSIEEQYMELLAYPGQDEPPIGAGPSSIDPPARLVHGFWELIRPRPAARRPRPPRRARRRPSSPCPPPETRRR